MIKWFQVLGIALTGACTATQAQNSLDTVIGLKDAVTLAQQQYHLLKARKYESDAAAKNVDVVKYSRLPSIDATYQAGLATANNLTGMFYPNGILPITGPPSVTNSYAPASGSAASLLLNWQASTFGERQARINQAVAAASSQKSYYQNELFIHSVKVISSYLDVLLTYDLVNIHRHNVERVQTNLRQSRVLARTGIKAGVDTALFLSELSKAKVELLNTQEKLEIDQWQLAHLVVVDALPVPADTSFLDRLPAIAENTDTSFSKHPFVLYQQSRVDESKSKELVLRKSFLPKLNAWGTTFARGSGFEASGARNTWDGLALKRFNYGAGLQLVFPIMKYGEVKRQLQQQSLLSKGAEENTADSRAALTTQQRIANATFKNSVTVAKETQQQLKSGNYAFSAMQDRYKTGLVNLADLIQAQSAVLSYKQIGNYLAVIAPYSGIITKRNINVGSLVGNNSDKPLFEIEDNRVLRLRVAVPEVFTNAELIGNSGELTTRSLPDKKFMATLARKTGSIDNETRSEMWEFEIPNLSGELKAGSYADVKLRFFRKGQSLVVPVSAVVTTLEKRFVIKVSNGSTKWVDVRPGFNMGDKQEIFGDLENGDTLVQKGNEELKPDTHVKVSFAK